MKEDNLISLADEVLAEDKEILAEVIEEDIKPILKHQKELADKAFEKEYKEVLELEGTL